jgi:oligopeptide/dipeptide ABC transporter ATP-binding protein
MTAALTTEHDREPRSAQPVLQVDDLKTHFTRRRLFGQPRVVRAVDGVEFTLFAGETLGLVGESGCGKSTLVRTILGLHEPTEGVVALNGTVVSRMNRRLRRPHRPDMQIVFQDPYNSLDPRMTVHDLVAEPLRINQRYSAERVDELLEQVGIDRALAGRRAAQFSGGQRQRICIARAIALNPDVVILDEPVSALDVSIQAQVINLLERLQRELGLAYLFIAHDLSVVRHISQRVAVMYLGKIVEIGSKDEVFGSPRHPYTRALLSAMPKADPIGRADRSRVLLTGDVPDPANPPSGCSFRTRCPVAQASCAEHEPALTDGAEGKHGAACLFPDIPFPTARAASPSSASTN